jgi:hypothetical protein
VGDPKLGRRWLSLSCGANEDVSLRQTAVAQHQHIDCYNEASGNATVLPAQSLPQRVQANKGTHEELPENAFPLFFFKVANSDADHCSHFGRAQTCPRLLEWGLWLKFAASFIPWRSLGLAMLIYLTLHRAISSGRRLKFSKLTVDGLLEPSSPLQGNRYGSISD